MKIKILSPLWGHEHLDYKVFLDKMRTAGYDGFDTWVPVDKNEKKLLYDFLQKHEMYLVAHQHRADGHDFTAFKDSFKKELQECAEAGPILINSHTGRDYFSFEQNLALVDIAQEFSAKTGMMIAHETHRGRLGYSPQSLAEYFNARTELLITADLSHWVCVTESLLQNFSGILQEAISRTRHIHARIGFEEGPQVPDPRAPEWQYAVNRFVMWWDEIIKINAANGCEIMPVTTEFGPQPYMPAIPFINSPVADQFTINLYMKQLLEERYASYI